MRATGDRDRRPSPYPRPNNVRRAPVVRNKTARRRYLGAATAVVVAGAVTMGFLGTSTATAEGSEREIVFSGSCGALGAGLGNNSTPDKESLTVTSGDKVTFTNNLGTDATLRIGAGESKVEEGDSKTITLTNSTEALMSPKCLIMPEDHSDKTTIKVKPKMDSHDGSNGDDGGSGNGGGSDNGGDSAGGGNGDNDSAAEGADKPGDSPDTGKKPKAEGKAGDPNKGDDAEQSDDQAAPGGSDSGSDDATKVDAANKVSTENSASALLAALAALCLAGVGFAALRTFITSRAASRA